MLNSVSVSHDDSLSYGPAVTALRLQSVLALAAFLLTVAIAVLEVTGLTPELLFAMGNGPHPLTLISIGLFSLSIYRPGPFKAQSAWRHGLFALVCMLSLCRLGEIFVLDSTLVSTAASALFGFQHENVSMGGNTAVVLFALSLGAVFRLTSSSFAFLLTVLGFIPVSYAFFGYAYGHSQSYGALSPTTLVLLSLVSLSQLCVFARTPFLRPVLSDSPWGRTARRQVVAIFVSLFLLGGLVEMDSAKGLSGLVLATAFWISVVIILATGPMFERIERERRHLTRVMRRQARHDPLTGLMNRRAVRDYIGTMNETGLRVPATTTGDPVGIILADIDHFKRVNDAAGHAVGDDVLREVGKRLRGKLRPSDFLARWGGEEFLVLLPGADLQQTMSMAQVLRTAVAAHVSWDNNGLRDPITLSLGVTVYDRHLGADTLEQAIQKADTALYTAKSKGRNQVQCSDKSAPKGKNTAAEFLPKSASLHRPEPDRA